MKTRLTADNPFGPARAGFAWEEVARRTGPHLDFGCYDGRFLGALSTRAGRRLVGIDANREAIDRAREQFPSVEFVHTPQPLPLPFADASFESVTLLDVLEHVPDQRALLCELRRVLRPDGILVVTVPRQHVFSVMDLGNLKFRFPRLHRWFYTLRHSPEEYRRRYQANPDGMIGDISAAKAWHEHFSERHLAALLGVAGFEVVRFDGSALFTRLFRPAAMILNRMPPLRGLLEWLARADARAFASMNLFCAARPVHRVPNPCP